MKNEKRNFITSTHLEVAFCKKELNWTDKKRNSITLSKRKCNVQVYKLKFFFLCINQILVLLSIKNFFFLLNFFSFCFRKINVTFFTRPITDCIATEDIPREYIIFCDLNGSDLQAISVAKWDENTDQRVWAALGESTLNIYAD